MKLEFLADGSSDCPLIRLYDFHPAEALRLKELFGSLANGSQTYIALHQQIGIEPVDGCELHLRSGTEDVGIVKKERLTFECLLTPHRWSDVTALAEAFCESADLKGHHQWLNEDGEISLLLTPSGLW